MFPGFSGSSSSAPALPSSGGFGGFGGLGTGMFGQPNYKRKYKCPLAKWLR
jgi:hypothetical protein